MLQNQNTDHTLLLIILCAASGLRATELDVGKTVKVSQKAGNDKGDPDCISGNERQGQSESTACKIIPCPLAAASFAW